MFLWYINQLLALIVGLFSLINTEARETDSLSGNWRRQPVLTSTNKSSQSRNSPAKSDQWEKSKSLWWACLQDFLNGVVF